MRSNLPIKVPTARFPQIPNIKWWFHRLRWREKWGKISLCKNGEIKYSSLLLCFDKTLHYNFTV